MKRLWTELYRPKTIDGYVFRDEKQKQQISKWIASGALPHMLLSGAPGTGKTTLIKILLNELGVNPFDVLEVNASRDNGVDYIKDTIEAFSTTMGFGEMKYIFLDEADGLSKQAQGVLRGTIEKYEVNVRFLLTCNYPHKIIDAIKSRCETGRMHIEKLDRDSYDTKLITILGEQNIEIDFDAFESIVQKTYPDLRRGISMIQANSINGKLVQPDAGNDEASDYKTDMIALFRAKRFKEARQLICEKISKDEYEDIYTFMYQNVDIWGETDNKQNLSIIAIRDGIVNHLAVADAEINLSATLCELEMIANGPD